MAATSRQQRRMRPYTRLPDPPESDGKPGGDDELGSSGLPDPSAASSKGGQSGRGARAATNEEQIKAQEAGQIKYRRRKKMRDEAPPHRQDEIIVVA